MITLTPSGDILLEGLGKVGEWYYSHVTGSYGKVKMEGIRIYNFYSYTNEELIEKINKAITNGFTPKKWEE